MRWTSLAAIQQVVDDIGFTFTGESLTVGPRACFCFGEASLPVKGFGGPGRVRTIDLFHAMDAHSSPRSTRSVDRRQHLAPQ